MNIKCVIIITIYSRYIVVYVYLCCVAVISNDHQTAELIMNASHPREQKALGRQVKNFNEVAWSRVCQQVVRQGNLAKVCYLAQNLTLHVLSL